MDDELTSRGANQIRPVKPTKTSEKMDSIPITLLDMPELVQHHLLELLKPNPYDVIRYRSVCRTTCDHVKNWPGQKIAFDRFYMKIPDSSTDSLPHTGIKPSVMMMVPTMVPIYKRPGLLAFLNSHQTTLKALHIPTYSFGTTTEEFNVFQILNGLEQLVVTELQLQCVTSSRFPLLFHQIKSLKLDQLLSSCCTCKLTCNQINFWSLLWSCNVLAFLRLPSFDNDVLELNLIHLVDYLMQLKPVQTNNTRLIIDFCNLQYSQQKPSIDNKMYDILQLCTLLGIKVWNFDSRCLSRLSDLIKEEPGTAFIPCVKSIVNIVKILDVQNPINWVKGLEKITFSSASTSVVGTSPINLNSNMWTQLPSLNEIKLQVDDDNFNPLQDNNLQQILDTFRPTVQKFQLLSKKGTRMKVEAFPALVIGAMIQSNCPNITSLTIQNWPAPNYIFPILWRLEFVKNLTILSCQNLSDEAFEYESFEYPGFLHMSRLEKFTLGLDSTNKITDQLFRDTLSKSQLRQFILLSDQPLEKVTVQGIQTLTTGPLSQTMERFPFNGWSLVKTSTKEMSELRRCFRCLT